MMEQSLEEYFVKSFIKKDRQERLLHELKRPDKRYRGLSRFCHQADDFIEPDKILIQGKKLETDERFVKFIEEHDEFCKILSPDPYLDGRSLKLNEALYMALASADAVIIILKGFAVIFTEAEKGGRDKYLLREKVGA